MESRSPLRATGFRGTDERYGPRVQDEFAWGIPLGKQLVVTAAYPLRYAADSRGGEGRLAISSNSRAIPARTAAV
jgi:hypothetical protein